MHYALESRDMAKTERGLVMSTIVEAATPLAAGGRMTVDEFDRIDESLDGPFELIDGQLIRKPDMDPPHVWSTERLRKRLERMLPEGCTVRDDKPLRIPDFNERRPDIAVVRGDKNVTKRGTPSLRRHASDRGVGVDPRRKDQGKKRPLYASSNIPDLLDRQRDRPTGRGLHRSGPGRLCDVRRRQAGQSVPG